MTMPDFIITVTTYCAGVLGTNTTSLCYKYQFVFVA